MTESRNPYAAAPPEAFWRAGVADASPFNLQGIHNPKWRITREDRIATAGSCFAQHIARFLRETTLEYGEYAARLVSNALQDEVERRANNAAESARMAAGWGGASPQFLALLATDDPLLRDPFLTPVETVRSRLEGEFIVSYETPGGWVGISKDILTDVLGAGRDAKIVGLPSAAANVLKLMCPERVALQPIAKP